VKDNIPVDPRDVCFFRTITEVIASDHLPDMI